MILPATSARSSPRTSGSGTIGTDAKTAQTLTFTSFVFFQVFNALNVRSEYGTIFTAQLRSNPVLLAGLGCVIALQVLVVSAPFAQNVFETTELTLPQWALATRDRHIAVRLRSHSPRDRRWPWQPAP
jgi:magnesium-transporting ATPase (P-type)